MLGIILAFVIGIYIGVGIMCIININEYNKKEKK